mgnify:CR=1 FL=1
MVHNDEVKCKKPKNLKVWNNQKDSNHKICAEPVVSLTVSQSWWCYISFFVGVNFWNYVTSHSPDKIKNVKKNDWIIDDTFIVRVNYESSIPRLQNILFGIIPIFREACAPYRYQNSERLKENPSCKPVLHDRWAVNVSKMILGFKSVVIISIEFVKAS